MGHRDPGVWDEETINKASRLWVRGFPVENIAAEIGKDIPTIYGFARDNRTRFPKRTQGQRKKNLEDQEIPPEKFPDNPIVGRKYQVMTSLRKLKASLAIAEKAEERAIKYGQKTKADMHGRRAELLRQEIKEIKSRGDNHNG